MPSLCISFNLFIHLSLFISFLGRNKLNCTKLSRNIYRFLSVETSTSSGLTQLNKNQYTQWETSHRTKPLQHFDFFPFPDIAPSVQGEAENGHSSNSGKSPRLRVHCTHTFSSAQNLLVALRHFELLFFFLIQSTSSCICLFIWITFY